MNFRYSYIWQKQIFGPNFNVLVWVFNTIYVLHINTNEDRCLRLKIFIMNPKLKI